MLKNIKSGDELKIAVANNNANAFANTDYFDDLEEKLIGFYHKKMVEEEKKAAEAPGLFGPVVLEKIK